MFTKDDRIFNFG